MRASFHLKLCVLFVGALNVGASCATAKAEARTALDDAAAACREQIPQGAIAIVDPKSGAIAQIVCATAEEIDAVVAPLLGARKAAAAAPAGGCPKTASVAIAVDAQGSTTQTLCLSRPEAEAAGAAVIDRRKAAAAAGSAAP
jgi:hypothetical protein